MEDEETGELFIPCRVCSLKCFKRHGKFHENQCFDGSASFFKVMLRDFGEKLCIPPAFVSHFLKDPDEHILLQGPDGQECEVQLLCSMNKLVFQQGWEKFVTINGVEMGDFLVFKYISRSRFKVKIFKRTGCVKNLTVCEHINTNVDTRCPSNKLGSKLLIDFVSDEKNSNAMDAIENNQNRHYGKNHEDYVSSVLVNPAITFKSDKPFWSMEMRSRNVGLPNMLEFPKECPLHLPKERGMVVLVDKECKEWEVRCIRRCGGAVFAGGWVYFARHHNIKKGDVCIFEQMDSKNRRFMLRVHMHSNVYQNVEEKTGQRLRIK